VGYSWLTEDRSMILAECQAEKRSLASIALIYEFEAKTLNENENKEKRNSMIIRHEKDAIVSDYITT